LAAIFYRTIVSKFAGDFCVQRLQKRRRELQRLKKSPPHSGATGQDHVKDDPGMEESAAPPPPSPSPFIDAADVFKIPAFLGMAAASWCLPERYWPLVARWTALGRNRVFARRFEADVATLPPFLLALIREAPEEVGLRFAARYYEEHMQVFRSFRPGGEWSPAFRVEGFEHVNDALHAGKGAILWVADFAYSSLLTKMALTQAGLWVNHLSRREHGFSRTRFGMRFLNPLQVMAENRYLNDRLVMDDYPESQLRPMLGCLHRNEVVSITAGNWARQTVQTRMFDGMLELAMGPARLSMMSGAALLPVFLTPGDDRSYDLCIEAPLKAVDGASREDALEEMAGRYATLLAGYVRRFPELWRGWRSDGNWKPDPGVAQGKSQRPMLESKKQASIT
jgi:lauroyl/myristoyl acyltransferase